MTFLLLLQVVVERIALNGLEELIIRDAGVSILLPTCQSSARTSGSGRAGTLGLVRVGSTVRLICRCHLSLSSLSLPSVESFICCHCHGCGHTVCGNGCLN